MTGASFLRELVGRYGSPLYVYDLAAVRDAHTSLRRALPAEAGLYYSLKANPHPSIVRRLADLGCGAEVSSLGEMAAALAAGVPPEQCLFTGPGKTEREARALAAAGIGIVSAESPRDLRALAAAGLPGSTRVVLRLNPDRLAPAAGLAMTGEASQFGVDTTWVREHPEDFHTTTPIRGLHVFAATNLESAGAVLESMRIAVENVQKAARALGIEHLETVLLGGGFGHPFARAGTPVDFRELRAPLEELLDHSFPGWRHGHPSIAFESGRFLAGSSGQLVCTVQDVKWSRSRRIVVLDSGINHLGGMAGLRRLVSMGIHPLAGAPAGGTHLDIEECDITGPTCTPLDCWAKGVPLPPVHPGDVVTVPNVGAYGLTASLLGFLSRECPAEIVVDGYTVVSAGRLTLQRTTAAPSLEPAETIDLKPAGKTIHLEPIATEASIGTA